MIEAGFSRSKEDQNPKITFGLLNLPFSADASCLWVSNLDRGGLLHLHLRQSEQGALSKGHVFHQSQSIDGTISCRSGSANFGLYSNTGLQGEWGIFS